MDAIEVNSLTKKFSNFKAIDNISFNVKEGEIFGFLGPNGAGKSTTMMILTTLLKPTSGKALVGGYNVVSDAKKFSGPATTIRPIDYTGYVGYI